MPESAPASSGKVIEERVRQQGTPESPVYKITKQRYDNLGHATEKTVVGDTENFTTYYTYDLARNLKTVQTPEGKIASYKNNYYYDTLCQQRNKLSHFQRDKMSTFWPKGPPSP